MAPMAEVQRTAMGRRKGVLIWVGQLESERFTCNTRKASTGTVKEKPNTKCQNPNNFNRF